MIEQWKPIEGYEDLYEISNLGNVKSLPKTRGCCVGGEKILKWCTASENTKHAYDNNLKKGAWLGKNDGEHPNSKRVFQYDKEMKLVKGWDSMSEAHRKTGVFVDSISKCCKKIYKTAGGYIWRYAN